MAAAKSERGEEALNYARFPDGENRPKVFARYLQLATAHILRDPLGPRTEAQNHVRDEMYHHIEIGLTEEQIQGRLHTRNAALRSVAAGAAGAALSGIGFHNDWYETLSFAAVGVGASATLDYAMAGSLRVTQKMIAARRKALNWLLFLMKSLHQWRGEELPRWEVEEGWREYLPRVLDFLVSESNDELKGFLLELDTVGRVQRLIETAERSTDEDLSRLLTEVETALEYNDLHDFPDAIRNLLYLMQDVSPKSGGYSRPEIAPGERPPQLPRIPNELE
ncbi:hypothetical protein ABTX60_15245 [Streptomyces sp. NPDC126510]|uniref:hypothetical protein n=1 Tax=Streptomyces sp. NPDC126510 TaxID=3155317 RepID=UPI00333079B1